MTTSNTDDFEAILQDALRVSQANDGPAAIKLFQRALTINPQSASTYCLLAAEYITLGQAAESEAAYAYALVLAPNFHLARFQLGLLQFTSARVAMALLTWQPLLALPDDQALKLFVMGFARMAQDEFDTAISYFEQGMRLNHAIAPLNVDIQRVITEIRRLHPVTPDVTAPANEENGTETESNIHFLLANYQQQEPGQLQSKPLIFNDL